MNHVFKLIWSDHQGSVVPVPEGASTVSKVGRRFARRMRRAGNRWPLVQSRDVFISRLAVGSAGIFAGFFGFSFVAYGDILPSNIPTADLLGTVQNNTAGQFADYTYTFTAATSGANYIGFAFRQDPAYWTFGNVALTVQGDAQNIISNGNMSAGGAIPGHSGLQAPTNWGVWY